MVDSQLSVNVELCLSASRLPRMDLLSKSDPFCVVSIRDPVTGGWRQLSRTETIDNNEDPTWKKRFPIDYRFEEVQDLLFEVYDEDSKSDDLKQQDFIGRAILPLSTILSSPGQVKTVELKTREGKDVLKHHQHSLLTVRGEEMTRCNQTIHFTMHGVGLDKMDWFGKSDPFCQFFRRVNDQWVQVHETEVIKSTLNPSFQPLSLPVGLLCNGDYTRPILVKCFDWNANSAADLIGELQFTIQQLLDLQTRQNFVTIEAELPLLRPASKNKFKAHGTLKITKGRITQEHSFLEFIRGGMQIGLMVAIDFTGSNGDPSDARSLHYRFGSTLNEYQTAIQAIGSILMPYDADQMVPVWGFGARIRSTEELSHCFPLTLNPNQVEVHGVEGLMTAYNNVFPHIALSGPTYFSEILQTADSIAQRPYTATFQHYSILLIITDGVINDMQQSIAAIVQASDRPLSIIIVGVGAADFSNMKILDADEARLTTRTATGQTLEQKRDTVQFVAMRDFKGQHPSLLAKETLAEIPEQITSFCKLHNIKPGNPRAPVQRQMTAAAMSHASLPLVHQPSVANMPFLQPQPSVAQFPFLQQQSSALNLRQPQQPGQYQQFGLGPQPSMGNLLMGQPINPVGSYPQPQAGYPPQQGAYQPQQPQGGYPPQGFPGNYGAYGSSPPGPQQPFFAGYGAPPGGAYAGGPPSFPGVGQASSYPSASAPPAYPPKQLDDPSPPPYE